MSTLGHPKSAWYTSGRLLAVGGILAAFRCTVYVSDGVVTDVAVEDEVQGGDVVQAGLGHCRL